MDKKVALFSKPFENGEISTAITRVSLGKVTPAQNPVYAPTFAAIIIQLLAKAGVTVTCQSEGNVVTIRWPNFEQTVRSAEAILFVQNFIGDILVQAAERSDFVQEVDMTSTTQYDDVSDGEVKVNISVTPAVSRTYVTFKASFRVLHHGGAVIDVGEIGSNVEKNVEKIEAALQTFYGPGWSRNPSDLKA